MGRRFSRHLFSMIALALATHPAFATVYECSPEQAVGWLHGKLYSAPKRTLTERLRFNDETGLLLDAASSAVPFSPTHFEIKQKISAENDLIAVAMIGDKVHFITSEELIIRSWDKEAGLIYFFTDGGETSSGHCVISAAKAGEESYELQNGEKQ